MTDNREQSERDCYQKHTDYNFRGFYLIFGVMFLAFAVYFSALVMVRARSHNVDLWLINGVNRLLAIFIACFGLWRGYRQIKTTTVGSWTPEQLLLFIRGTFASMFLYTAWALMLLVMSYMFH